MKIDCILIPVDFSDVTARVVEAGGDLARACKARVVLLHVSEPDPDFVGFETGPQTVRAAVARDFRGEHHKLDQLKAPLVSEGIETLALHIQGSLAEKILEEAEEQKAGMIVIGSHGHGAFYNLLVGSVTSGVLKGAQRPVLVVPAAGTEL